MEGTYDEAFELCLKAAPEFAWYNHNTACNPYVSEGKKTIVYEVCEQLGDSGFGAPDMVLMPVGDGCIIGGAHKGFKDLSALGWIEQLPRILGVQAAGSSPRFLLTFRSIADRLWMDSTGYPPCFIALTTGGVRC